MITTTLYPTRSEAYRAIVPQIRELLRIEHDQIANMANISAILHSSCNFLWVGFYRVSGEELILGPFQGPPACTRIGYGRGVCGTAWLERRSIIVPDVDQFDGHIACSNSSKSEIVIPVLDPQGELTAILDVDSDQLDDFSDIDLEALIEICNMLYNSNK